MEEETKQKNDSPLIENARLGVSKKHRSHCCPNEDRLSKMPDSILLHILSFLPATDVVKTGVLSQSWAYLWTCAPILDFICPNWYHQDEKFKSAITVDDHIANFTNFVKKTLIFHQCTHLRKFSLECKFEESDNDFVNTCVRFAIRANVEELCLNLIGGKCGRSPYKLRQYLFKNSTITKLLLNYCEFEPTGLISWKMLKSLTICYSYLNENLIQNILAGSPTLEFLKLQCVHGFHCLDISKSNLKKLVVETYYFPNGYYDHPVDVDEFDFKIIAPKVRSLSILGGVQRPFDTYMLSSATMLEDCDLSFEFDDIEEEINYMYHANWIRELLQRLVHVNKLSLGNFIIENLSIMAVEAMPFPQFQGKCLILDTSIQECDIPGIASLLRSSPNLETLVVNMCYNYEEFYNYDYDVVVENKNYWTSQEGSSECSLLHLKTVEINGYEAGRGKCEFVIQFAQFLVRSARVLEKMVINSQKLPLVQSQKAPQSLDTAQAWNLFQVTQKLLRFPLSSPQAEVMFSE